MNGVFVEDAIRQISGVTGGGVRHSLPRPRKSGGLMKNDRSHLYSLSEYLRTLARENSEP